MSDFKKIAQFYREMAEISENLADLEERKKKGENVNSEYAAAIGMLVLKQAEMNKI